VLRTFAQLERDLAERLPETALANALALTPGIMEVVRYAPQAGLMRVVYRVEPQGLMRNDVLLLPGASALKLRVHAGGFWAVPGEPRVQPPVPPSAVEVAVEHARGERYVKVLPL
jgi:hypothetical protein